MNKYIQAFIVAVVINVSYFIYWSDYSFRYIGFLGPILLGAHIGKCISR